MKLNKNLIVIELKATNLAAVEVAAHGPHLELLHYVSRPLPVNGITPDWLRQLWQTEGFTHRQVIAVLPNDLIKYKTVTIPALAAEQLAAAVRFELESNNGDDLVWQVINRQQQGELLQLRVAVINDAELEAQTNLLAQADLELRWFGLRSRGIANFISYNKDFFTESAPAVAYLDLTDHESEFGVVNEDQIQYCRNFTVGQSELQSGESETAATDFGEELRLSLAASRSTTGATLPSQIWVFGRTGPEMAVIQEAAKRLGLELKLAAKSGLAGVPVAEITPELAPLIGLALEAAGYNQQAEMGIYSRQQAGRRARQQRQRLWFEVAGLALLVAAGIALGVMAGAKREAKAQEWLREKEELLVNLEQTEIRTRQNLGQIRELERWLEGRGLELEFLRVLQQSLPAATRITDITIEDGVVKDLSGITPSVSLVLKEIARHPELRQLRLRGTIAITDDGELFHLAGPIKGQEVKQQ